MEKMHGKRNERCWQNVGGSKQESSRQGCVENVAYTLTGVRGNDDDIIIHFGTMEKHRIYIYFGTMEKHRIYIYFGTMEKHRIILFL